MNQINVVLESLKTFWIEFGDFLPQLTAAFLLLIVGWLIAKLIRKAFVRVLRLLRLDVAAEKFGIENFLLRERPKLGAPHHFSTGRRSSESHFGHRMA